MLSVALTTGMLLSLIGVKQQHSVERNVASMFEKILVSTNTEVLLGICQKFV